jgi:TonB-linked SusC/RagA family outer membrane protein
MRLLFWLFICFIFLRPTYSLGYAQIDRVNINGTFTLLNFFRKIEEQTGKAVYYANNVVNDQEKVTVNLVNCSVDDAMKKVLGNKDVQWIVEEQFVTIKKKEKPRALLGEGGDSTITVTGRVVNEKGEPIPGATVVVKGEKKGGTTGNDGMFQIKNVNPNASLIITNLAYLSQGVPINGRDVIGNIELKPYIGELDETVVKGYYNTTKRLNTGNVSTIKAKDIEKQPVGNVLLALAGRVPGMLITQQTGVPGGGINVQIRGQNSISQDNEPFYVIDGVPYTSSLLSNVGGLIIGAGNPLNYINPADIESVDILKDADATAIYGSRAANGVILITTKKGKSGTSKLDINLYKGISKITRKAKVLGLKEYLQMRKEAYRNDDVIPGPGIYDINGTWDTTHYTDWQQELLNGTSQTQNAEGVISGGNTLTQYLIGAGYRKETPMFPGRFSDQKVSVHFNVNAVSNNRRLKAMLSGSYMIDNNNLPTIDITSQALSLPPNAPKGLNPDGSLNWANGTFNANPYYFLFSWYKGKTNNLISSSLLSYEIIPGLLLKSSLGYTNMQIAEINTTTIASKVNFPGIVNPTGSAVFSNNNISSWIAEPQLTYEKVFSKSHLNALIGLTFQENIVSGQIINGDGYTNDAFLSSLSAASNISKGGNTYEQYKYTALYGRINYNYEDKYLMNVTMRRDGSSRFAPGRQFGNFGALGLAWIFTKENFIIQSGSALSFGKLRASYGTSGNQPGINYGYLELYNFNTGSIPYQGGQGLKPVNIFAPDFAWERNKKLEGGLEMGFFKDKLLFTSSYFRNRSSNQLISYQLPNISGFSYIISNLPATVQNVGWEFTINTLNVTNGKVSWSSNLNLTISKNKLVSFPKIEDTNFGSSLVIGESIRTNRVYKFADVDPGIGIYRFYDSKGKLTYSPNFDTDRIMHVSIDPKYYGGLQNSLSYKGIELDFLIQFVKQIGVNYLFTSSSAPGTSRLNRPSEVLNRWQKPGDIVPYEKFTSRAFGDVYDAYKYAQQSDYAYSDASFIRLKNLSISYSLPVSINRQIHVKNVRLYIQCQNLLTITKYKGMDPENQSVNALPPLRIATVGIQTSL